MKKTIAGVMLFSAAAFAADVTSDQVRISEFEVVANGWIKGLAKNDSESSIRDLFIRFNLYRDGELVGKAIAQASDVNPWQSFRFKASPSVEEFDEAELVSVNVY